jgi:hypothetical protein
MGLWSMGLAVCRRAHRPRCSLWVPVRLPEASKRPVSTASLMTVRKVVADRESAEDDLWCHRLPGEPAELGPPTPSS